MMIKVEEVGLTEQVCHLLLGELNSYSAQLCFPVEN